MAKRVKIYPSKYIQRWTRLILGLALVPAAVGITQTFYDYIQEAWPSWFPFVIGVLCYTLIYPVFRKPLRAYVLGHELTHVLGVWLFRGKIRGMKLTKRGGVVKADRTNLWIKLAPYFFPIYTVLVLGLYLLISILWDLTRYYNLVVFILGFTWAFHLWMTLNILWQNQPDIRDSGIVFSLVFIYILNLVVLTLLVIFISPELTINRFLLTGWQKIGVCYLWLIKKFV